MEGMRSAPGPVSRVIVLGYAVIAYAAFVASASWAVGFLACRGAPTCVDAPVTRSAWTALGVDAALLLAFALQHTVMARTGFKRRVTRLIPPAAERSTFVLVTSLLLLALFGWWQPVGGTLWHVDEPWSAAIWAVYGAGWVLVVWSTFAVDHADFLGVKQAYRSLRRRDYRPPEFTQGGLYAWCRHPMMLGLLIAFWATPRMTAGHLAFAVATTGYIAVGIRFEERALVAQLGPAYEDYARRVPALVPALVRAPGRGLGRTDREPTSAG
jgi:protein-S-isoprenylcysteine O-methyltransferase Ste14